MAPDASRADAYNALCCYTLAHGDPSFIHQHVVDAFTAQNADETTKPIALTFALVGLYLHIDRGFSGKQVQRAHMTLARQKRAWPTFALPRDRGRMTVIDVMGFAEGPERDEAIDRWCAAVWEAFRDCHAAVVDIVRS
jgi:hypothetical protein